MSLSRLTKLVALAPRVPVLLFGAVLATSSMHAACGGDASSNSFGDDAGADVAVIVPEKDAGTTKKADTGGITNPYEDAAEDTSNIFVPPDAETSDAAQSEDAAQGEDAAQKEDAAKEKDASKEDATKPEDATSKDGAKDVSEDSKKDREDGMSYGDAYGYHGKK